MSSDRGAHLHVVPLSVSAEPLALARRVWGAGSALLWSADGSGTSYLATCPVAVSAELEPEPELGWGPSAPASQWGNVPRWIGVLPYEAQRSRWERSEFAGPDQRETPLLHAPVWHRYGAVAVITDQVHVVGDDARAVRELSERLSSPVAPSASESANLVRLHVAEDAARAAEHRRLVARALELIRDGDVYEINLARRLEFDVQGDSLALLRAMSETVRAPYAAALELPDELGVVSTSPELCLQTDAKRRLFTAPIKGTRPRTGDVDIDAAVERELEADPKERAELSMVVDVERSDIGRVAEFGSVIAETPRVLPYSTVFHRVARVRGMARLGVTRRQVFEAMLPSGSVTGAPKVRAMELIASLEPHRRGLYTGALGYIGHDGCVQLGMAIRCLVRRGPVAHYHVGGGIVIRSDPEREFQETLWKAEQVLRTRTG